MRSTMRHQQILKALEESGSMSVQGLCERIFASPATVRRDLHALEGEGLVQLYHGGARLNVDEPVVPLSVREFDRREVKARIAQRAFQLLPETGGATIMLDGSSTALHLVSFLEPRQKLTVFTNCLRTAGYLCEKHISTYFIGGQMDMKSLVTVGSLAAEQLRNVHVDLLFFSSQGIDREGIITDNSESETWLRKIMLERAEKAYFLCDEVKVGRKCVFTVCRAQELTGVISDADLSEIPDIRYIRA